MPHQPPKNLNALTISEIAVLSANIKHAQEKQPEPKHLLECLAYKTGDLADDISAIMIENHSNTGVHIPPGNQNALLVAVIAMRIHIEGTTTIPLNGFGKAGPPDEPSITPFILTAQARIGREAAKALKEVQDPQ